MRRNRALRCSAFLPVIALLLVPIAVAHGHRASPEDAGSTSPWKTSSAYALSEGTYSLQFCRQQREDGMEGVDGVVFELLAVASTDDAEVVLATDTAESILRTFSYRQVLRESVTNGTMLAVKSSSNSSADVDYLYRVEFASQEEKCVDALLPIAIAGDYMLFTEHGVDDVSVEIQDAKQGMVSVAKCISGCPVQVTELAFSTRSQSWVGPIVASLIISLTSIVGVVILSFDKGRVEVIVEYMTSFAAGCLLGVVVFHLYPEGTEYLADLGDWVMGACVLGGVIMSMSIEAGVHMMLSSFGADHCSDGHSHGHHPHHDHATMDHTDRELSPQSTSPSGHSHASHHNHNHHDHVALEMEGSQHGAHPIPPSEQASLLGSKRPQSFWSKSIRPLQFVEPVAWITAIGDFFHAFTDGVVLAVAFKSCSSTLGWAVALGIVLHEVPHRVGDFFIFLKAGMTVPQALSVNFVASLASLVGVIVLLSSGAVSNHTLGVLLAVGTGALLFIGLTELLPPMLAVRDRNGVLLHFAWFILGCVLIGLSVLQDTHCDA